MNILNRFSGDSGKHIRISEPEKLMDDVMHVVYSEPSFLMTALNIVLPLVYLFGLFLLVCLLVYLLIKHLRKGHAGEKRKNH